MQGLLRRDDPCRLEGAERELARELFGNIDTIPPQCRTVVAWLKGARVGGSYLCALLSVVSWDYLPADTAPASCLWCQWCTRQENGNAAIPVPGGRGSGMRRAQAIGRGDIGAESFIFDDLMGTVSASKCSRPVQVVHRSADGHTSPYCSTNPAFFSDPATGCVNELELYRAGAPRIVTGGCLMIISTAFARRGLLWEMVERNYGNPQTCLAAIAPTLLVRPTEQNRRIYEEGMARDEEATDRELNCVALSAGTSDFIEPESIRQCEDEDLPLVTLPEPGDATFSGIDTGFKRDANALVVTHKRYGCPLLVAECYERKPELQGATPKVVLAEFAKRLNAHHCRSVSCDQHYVMTVRDELVGFNIQECSPTLAFKLESYTYVRDLLRSRGVVIPAGNRRLISQLRDVQVRPLSGGGMQIFQPKARRVRRTRGCLFRIRTFSVGSKPIRPLRQYGNT